MTPREESLTRRLEALHQAALAIASELSLPALLQRITDSARELTGARYAALGVSDEDARELTAFITSGLSREERARIGLPPRGHGLLGVILRGRRPVRLPNIAAHPQSSGFPPNHPPMTSFLGVPILLGERNLGNLYLTDKEGASEFSEDDEQVLVQLAAHAAIAIQNARLYSQTSAALQRHVAELREASARQTYLSSLALNAQEEERRRLARDLHDGAAQSLASLLLRLRLIDRTDDVAEIKARVEDVRELVTRALDEVRRMAVDLRPSSLDDLGLAPALESHIRERADRWPFRVRFAAKGIDQRLPASIEVVVYRVVQEALTNIVKHARASVVSVSLERQGGVLHVTITDDGAGFDVERTFASKERGLGLYGMQERASLVNGRIAFTSSPGQGTTVALAIPLPVESETPS